MTWLFIGPTVCETVYESECETHYHVHEVEDDTPKCQVVLVSSKHPDMENVFVATYRFPKYSYLCKTEIRLQKECRLSNAMLSVALAYITLITLTDVMTAPY